jgi:iron complex outermembrane receptor protein
MIAASTAPRAEEGGAEDDYFGALPVVLTVSRLAQPLSDTPGAVTVLDRDKIRRSGARDVADLMRMVPGYMVAGWNGANPNAAYHAPVDEYGTRNLVLIDGRSVYSPFYLGNTNKGMLGVMLEDIERIEVLRGSNSAAYGANAMFGVINIVTRHSGDTHGAEVVVAGGNDGLADVRARVGWGNDAASFRLSTGRRADHGYRNAFDDMVLRQTHFRADLRPSVSDDMLVEAGGTEFSGGEGFWSTREIRSGQFFGTIGICTVSGVANCRTPMKSKYRRMWIRSAFTTQHPMRPCQRFCSISAGRAVATTSRFSINWA